MPAHVALLVYALLAAAVLPGLAGLTVGHSLSTRRPERFHVYVPWLSWCFALRSPALVWFTAAALLAATRDVNWLGLAVWGLAGGVIEAAWEWRKRRSAPRKSEALALFADDPVAGMQRLVRCNRSSFSVVIPAATLGITLLLGLFLVREGMTLSRIAPVAACGVAFAVLLGRWQAKQLALRIASYESRWRTIRKVVPAGESLRMEAAAGHLRGPRPAGAWPAALGRAVGGLFTGALCFLLAGFLALVILVLLFPDRAEWPESSSGTASPLLVLWLGSAVLGACLNVWAGRHREVVSGGWLYLTDRQLVFHPDDARTTEEGWSVPLEQLHDTDTFGTAVLFETWLAARLREGLRLTTADGPQHFHVADPHSWITAITWAKEVHAGTDNRPRDLPQRDGSSLEAVPAIG